MTRRVPSRVSWDVFVRGWRSSWKPRAKSRGLKRCFGLDSAIVTAFVDNPVGRLLQDMIYQGGVDQSLVRWVADDGVGRSARIEPAEVNRWLAEASDPDGTIRTPPVRRIRRPRQPNEYSLKAALKQTG